MVRILVLIASLVLLLPGAAPALQPGATFRGDPQAVAEVKAAFDRFGALRTYRVRMTTPGREGATMVEFVAPDRFRMQIPSAGQPMEIFVVGTEVWMRTGAACQNLPAAMPGAFNPREVDPNAAQGTMTVSRGGPETVEGTPTQTYAMEVAVQGTLVRQKLYVATDSGLPTVIDYHDQQPTLLMGGQPPPLALSGNKPENTQTDTAPAGHRPAMIEILGGVYMPRMLILILIAGLALSLSPLSPAVAGPGPESTPGYRGLGLSTPYPSQTVRAGDPVTLALAVKNYGLAPQVVTLAVAKGVPGWKVSFLGAGRTVTAVAVGTDQEATLSVRLDPPPGARAGTYRFVLTAQGQGVAAELPLALTLGQVQPGRLELQAELPVLRGPGTSSFRYRLTIKNESEKDMLVSLEAQMPKGFQVAFTPAFGSQQVTSLPVKAGEPRDLDAEVTLPQDVPAGTHALSVRAISGEARAEVKLTIEVTGRPDLSITTPEGRLSGRAYAGRDTPIKVVVKNRGSAPARGIEVSSYEPTGWQVKFDPSRIEEIAPKGEAQVTATVRPSSKAIAGDYMLTLRATAGDSSSSADFRVTVFTSTLWGIVGVIVIAVALGIVSLVVSRYGRR